MVRTQNIAKYNIMINKIQYGDGHANKTNNYDNNGSDSSSQSVGFRHIIIIELILTDLCFPY